MTTTDGSGIRSSQPPIGFLLRTLDRLIDERFELTLGARGITRRQWQLLSALAGGPATLEALSTVVAPFLDRAAGETAERHLDALAEHGLVATTGGTYGITGHGRALFAELAEEVQVTRDLTVRGLAEGEYERTVTSLQAMVANLVDDSDEDPATP